MYKIDIEPVEKPKSRAKDLLETMMDVMENIEHVDDAAYVLRMKVLNNIEFLVDVLMQEYENGKSKVPGNFNKVSVITTGTKMTSITEVQFQTTDGKIFVFQEHFLLF